MMTGHRNRIAGNLPVPRARHVLPFLAIVLLAVAHGEPSSVGMTPTPSPATSSDTLPGTWKLIWADEFDHDGAPDPTKWDYEVGFIRNRESQYYTKARTENARVEQGVLVIEARKENYRNPQVDHKSRDWRHREFADYTSSSLTTLGKASWTYCRIEVRAKLPGGPGTWPAIWTLGVDRARHPWPLCGELDIMESVGKAPKRASSNVHFPNKTKEYTGAVTLQDSYSAAFHVFAMERYPDRIDFFVDGKKYNTFTVDDAGCGEENPFRKPHYLLINLAMGGIAGGKIDDASLPQKYLIDYVRVYQLTDQVKDSQATAPTGK